MALIATVLQEDLVQMQHLAYFQNHIDVPFFQLQQAQTYLVSALFRPTKRFLSSPHPMDAARPHGACKQM
jgi:hypothetical protein